MGIREQARSYRQKRQIPEALAAYRSLWQTVPAERQAWDGWGYAWCLYQQKDYAQALEIVNEAEQIESLPVLSSLKAWCLYQLPSVTGKQIENATHQILACGEPYSSYSPAVKSVLACVDAALDPRLALTWLQTLDPEQLSQAPQSQTDQRGKTIPLPSDWLRYQSRLSKTYYALRDYAACEQSCREVLAQRQPAQQAIWFQRRLAQSLVAQQIYPEAQQIYKTLLERQQQWFLCKELAQITYQLGQREQAKVWAAEAALRPGEPDKKLKLYETLADWLQDSHPEISQQHTCLAICIREGQGWPLNAAQKLYADTHPTAKPLQEQLAELQLFWQKQAAQNVTPSPPTHTGSISKLLANGHSGFIKDSQGQHWYFRARSLRGSAEVGLPVQFCLQDSFDHKKQRPTQEAVAIRLLEASHV